MNNERKVVLVIAIFLVASGVVWFVGTDTLFCLTVSYDGAGTAENPYEVSNVEQLQCIEEQSLYANYVQVSDIDASETSGWNLGGDFEPIGELINPEHTTARYSYVNSFSGTFDGRGHNTDLKIDRGSEENVGVFGLVGTAGEVTRVSVVDRDIKGSDKVGSIVGENTVSGTVERSHATLSVDGHSRVGGLIGSNGGTVSESYGSIESADSVEVSRQE